MRKSLDVEPWVPHRLSHIDKHIPRPPPPHFPFPLVVQQFLETETFYLAENFLSRKVNNSNSFRKSFETDQIL